MSFRSLNIAVGFALAVAAPIVAQNGRAPTFAELLQKHHVALTKPALLAALRNPEAQVRDLAAAQLAEDKAQDAIPAITQALATERVPGTKVNIAFALAQLRNEAGISTLEEACHNSNVDPGLRLRAARYLLDLNSNACLPDVIELLQSKEEDDASYRMEALSLVPSFKDVSEDESQKLLGATLENLTDTTPAVRLSASDALARLGYASAIPYLHDAIGAEQDEVVREQLEDALRRLQQKH
jgi:HEAT repeat protein